MSRGMGHMATVGEHLSVEELEARYVGCQDVTASRHFQVIWLLARGHTISQVSETTAFARPASCDARPRIFKRTETEFRAYGCSRTAPARASRSRPWPQRRYRTRSIPTAA